MLDITALPGLRGVADEGDAWRIPALTTWTDLAETPLPPELDGLRAAARTIGGRQIQNAGTVVRQRRATPRRRPTGCPTCWRSTPRSSSRRPTATRVVPIADFVLGNRRTDLRAGELVTGLRVPKVTGGDRRGDGRRPVDVPQARARARTS